jgi:hypothetical protein
MLDGDNPDYGTAPAAEYVAAILGDERTGAIRVRLLGWLKRAADAALNSDPDYFPSVEEFTELQPDLYFAVQPFAGDPDPEARRIVAGLAQELLSAPELATEARLAATQLIHDTRGAPVADRAEAALTLGNWRLAPVESLTDEHRAVRVCAALAPALDDDATALAEVRAALRHAADMHAWLGPGVPDRLPERLSFSLVLALLRRTSTFDEIAEEAVAVARTVRLPGNEFLVLLFRAFSGKYAEGQPLTVNQRRLLTAHADNDACWNAQGQCWPLTTVGLPRDRDAIHRLVRTY